MRQHRHAERGVKQAQFGHVKVWSKGRRLKTRAFSSPSDADADADNGNDGNEMDYRAFRARLVARHKAEELTMPESDEATGSFMDTAQEARRGEPSDAASGPDGANERWMYETPLLEQGTARRQLTILSAAIELPFSFTPPVLEAVALAAVAVADEIS